MVNITTKTELINYLFEYKLGYKKSYLEIGLSYPEDNYYYVFSANKESVDPLCDDDILVCDNNVRKYIIDNVLTYRMTSDDFFAQCDKKYDLIFIDGLHIADQVQRDIINSYNHLNEGGFIVIHDCLPPFEARQFEDNYEDMINRGLGWNGSTWKALPNLDKAGLDFQVLDIDEGCGIIKYDGPKDFSNYTVTDLSYNDVFLDTDVRNKIMHVKSIQEFLLNV